MPELLGRYDCVDPREHVRAAVLANHSRLWIFDVNAKQIAGFRLVPAFIEITVQDLLSTEVCVPQHEGPDHLCSGILADPVFWNVFVEEIRERFASASIVLS
ncbi:MAG: hypothetical protein ACLQGV_12735 [Bryobacteraceae bacterium]